MSNKKIIKELSKYKKKYDLFEFNNIASEIHKKVCDDDDDEDETLKIICKYSDVSNGKIIIDMETKSNFKYKELKNKLEEDKKKQISKSNIKKNRDDSSSEVVEKKKVQFEFNISKDDVSDSESESETVDNKSTYVYPTEIRYKYIKRTDEKFGPYGSDWTHDKYTDDEIPSEVKKRSKIVKKLMEIDYPEQKSQEWLDQRKGITSASDGGCVVDVNHYEPPYNFLHKKVTNPPFPPNINCHHGCKYEQVATNIYSYRMNVQVEEFGLVRHPEIDFLGASPDGIVGLYKLDGKSLTKYVGRMVEIKCPTTRQIQTSGKIYGGICPEYYWVQVQLQLECCDLEECDFWQCKLYEYKSREDFIKDTMEKEPFRSKTTELEKGCVIQLMPKNKVEEIKEGGKDAYLKVLYDKSKYLYPPKIEMSPYECDMWVLDCVNNFHDECIKNKIKEPEDYYIDKVIYWRLDKSHSVIIKRDRDWFEENLPKIEKMWRLVEYFRKNSDKAEILFDYMKSLPFVDKYKKNKDNAKVMDAASFLANEPKKSDESKQKKYHSKIIELLEETKENLKKYF